MLVQVLVSSFSDAEIPAGPRPGNLFTLNNGPNPVASLILTWNGVVLAPVKDFVLSGNVLTTVQKVNAGDSFICWYRY